MDYSEHHLNSEGYEYNDEDDEENIAGYSDEYGETVVEEEMYDQTHYNYDNSTQCGNIKLTCDTCERDFINYWYLEKHMSEHKTCGLDGCTFTAHQKIIEKHIRMQHSTGLYEKMRNISTPEDIVKWIEERKKRYPSKQNIEKRYKQQEEMLKRGERIQKNKDRFGRKNNSRLQKPRGWPNRNKIQKTSLNNTRKQLRTNNKKTESLIDEKADWNGDMFPFKGTADLYKIVESKEQLNFDDTEWVQESATKTVNKIVLNNALGALMGAYNSSDDSDLDEIIPKTPVIANDKLTNILTKELDQKTVHRDSSGIIDKNTKVQISDDEAPKEEKISRLPDEVSALIHNTNVNTCQNKSTDILEGTVVRNTGKKGTRKRKRCRQHHNVKVKQFRTETTDTENKASEGVNFINRKFKKRKATLLEKLLENEIRHERNVLLQCVRYVIKSNFFN